MTSATTTSATPQWPAMIRRTTAIAATPPMMRGLPYAVNARAAADRPKAPPVGVAAAVSLTRRVSGLSPRAIGHSASAPRGGTMGSQQEESWPRTTSPRDTPTAHPMS
jgi:hypothetical protein